jgi:hypothetical protein
VRASLVAAVAVVLGWTSGCATPDAGRASQGTNAQGSNAQQSATPEREARCRNLMYTERAARGRAAVNWTLYDRCMRED